MGIFEEAFLMYRPIAKVPKDLDLFMIGFPIPAVNLKPQEGLVKCEIEKLEDFKFMAEGADEVVFTLNPQTQSPIYACVYKSNDVGFPIPRFYIYNWKSKEDIGFIEKFESKGNNIKRLPRDEWFGGHLFKGDAKKAVASWLKDAHNKGLLTEIQEASGSGSMQA